MKERGTADREPKKVKKEPVAETVKDPNAIRTLVLSGLPKDITKNVLWKRVRKVHDGVDLRYPVEGEADTGTSAFNLGRMKRADNMVCLAHIIFPSHNEALQSLGKLHGHTYKGLVMSCVLKKRLEKLTAGGEGKSPSHAGRLIIRNLSWDVSVSDLGSF
jgi:nucleolar protein 4